MGLYKYIVASRNEGSREILIEADSPAEALNKIRSRRLTPVRCLGEAEVGKGGFSLFHRTKIDTFVLTRQLAPLLNSYIPLERALGIIADSTDEPEQKAFVNGLRQGLHEGKKFSELVRSNGSLFPDYYANLVESGEESGCLPDVVSQLYKFMAESKELRGFLISSSIYPAVILSVTLLVVILMFTVFVPRFVTIFEDMGRETPGSMNFLLGLSGFFKWAWWMIPLVIVAGRFALIRGMGRREYDETMAAFKLRIPLIGPISASLEVCRCLRTMAIMTANHVEIIRTVRIAGRIIHNPVVAKPFQPIADRLKGGERLSAALQGNPYVPRETTPMLRVGEESGNLGEMLMRIADNLETDTRSRIKRLLSLFEPAVILFLAACVLLVVVSIFSAMMELNAIT